MANKNFIITVPHAKSGLIGIHPSDTVAEEFALLLYSKIKNSEILIGDKPREIVDYNRKHSILTPWRFKLRKLIQNANFVLDVHSFPTEKKLTTYILYQPPNENVAYKLGSILEEWGTSIRRGINNNIMDEAIANNIPTLLLEISETNRFNFEVISDKVVSFFKKNGFIF